MYIVTLMADVDDGMMANVDMIVNIQKVVKNTSAKTDFMMSAEDFHCDLEECNLHYIEPCEICTKRYCEAHLPFSQHVWISPDNRREEYAKAQSSFYSYATETSDDNTQFLDMADLLHFVSILLILIIRGNQVLVQQPRRVPCNYRFLRLQLFLHRDQQLHRVPYLCLLQQLQSTLHLYFKGLQLIRRKGELLAKLERLLYHQ